MNKIDNDISLIHNMLMSERFFYVKDKYLEFGLEVLYDDLKPYVKDKIYVLDELNFLSVYTLLYMISFIYECGDVSIIILSDRIIQEGMSVFFVSKYTSLEEWRKVLATDNSKQIKKLISYYNSICSGGMLTHKEYSVLLVTKRNRCINSICKILNLNGKQVSYYHTKLKDKLGIHTSALFNNYINWL
ncbi:hypothetical protein PGO14_25330 [Klebsiella aerogenes]